MSVWEILLMSAAMAMDACAVGMGDGMAEPKMKCRKSLLIGGFFGFFQFVMPLIGYYLATLIAGAFIDTFEKISGFIAFFLLAFLGGKMIFECGCEMKRKKCEEKAEGACPICKPTKLTLPKLVLQSIATSIDALAIGVSLKMTELMGKTLAFGAWGSFISIGVITFLLSAGAVHIGKKLGDKLADKANLCGGIVLIGIGVKFLIESLFLIF